MRVAFTVLPVAFIAAVACAQVEILPAPVVNANSFEVLSNSRYSSHSGFASTLPRQVLSNVLWAMNRVPRLGTYREFYIATPANVYRYDTAAHSLVVHLSGNHRYNSGSSYEVAISCDRYEEAGYAIQAGLLAGTAFWNSTGGTVISCPMKYAADFTNTNWNPVHPIKMVNVYGQGTATGLRTTVQAVSSDLSLPAPRTTAADTFEVLLSTLHQSQTFNPVPLTPGVISQLLWAGYGVTPHVASGGSRGTTIPSAMAVYYLTRKIYLVRDTAVQRYNNRTPPGTGLTTGDHRLERVVAGDRRPQLRTACSRIAADAPAYIVVCVSDTSRYGDMIEAGFAGFQYLMQALSLGLDGLLTAPITPVERAAVITALGIPAADQPAVIFSCGTPAATGIVGSMARQEKSDIGARATGNRVPIRIEYFPGTTPAVRLAILDLAGRSVREFACATQSAGMHTLDWDGRDNSGVSMPAGIYFCRLTAGPTVRQARFILNR